MWQHTAQRSSAQLSSAQLSTARRPCPAKHSMSYISSFTCLCSQAYRNSVPVPRHWSQKRKYLQGKRGIEKPPFVLPDFIEATGIGQMRQAYQVSLVKTTSHILCMIGALRLAFVLWVYTHAT